MYKYACLNPIADVGLRIFDEQYEKTEDVAQAEAILVRSAKMHDMEFSENLVAVARAGAGVNNIPLEKCAEEGIVVFNTPGANANGVKELVLAGMLLASRGIVDGIHWVESEADNAEIATVAEKQKKAYAGTELYGKKLGVIGLGAIGVRVANAAVKLGMDVLGYDPYVSVDAAWNLSRSIRHCKDLDEIYAECDFITIHVPAMDSTKGMIDAQAISKMKENVVLCNFARDVLVDENAVVKALEEGKMKRYVSDFPNPVTAGKKGCIVIPHLGASTEESEDNCAIMAVKELREYMENGNIINSVNYPNCNLGKCTGPQRICIMHKNVSGMIGQYTSILGAAGVNIANMDNKTRGDVAYSVLDVDSVAQEQVLRQIMNLEGVIRVRAICG